MPIGIDPALVDRFRSELDNLGVLIEQWIALGQRLELEDLESKRYHAALMRWDDDGGCSDGGPVEDFDVYVADLYAVNCEI